MSNKNISNIIRDCAKQIITPRFRNLKDGDVQSKTSPMDLVTIADIEAEHYLQEKISKEISGAIVIGEESVSRGEFKIEGIDELKNKTIFIVDPIDGTSNFVKGSKTFAVMVAKLDNLECTEAWIYDVTEDEMITAKKGEGAYNNNRPIAVSPRKNKEELTGFGSLRYLEEDMKKHFKAQRTHIDIRDSLSCAGHEYLQVAKGQADFTIFTRLKPWDHLPGILICEEAGGYSRNWDGSNYTIGNFYKGLLTANSSETWNLMHRTLIEPYMQ